MSYVKKSYCVKENKMVTFSGHISKETAKKRGFDAVALSIIDNSGKRRGKIRVFDGPDFNGMKKFN